ncbi:hypothetical protein MBLNU459_g3613t1 [Dothideomycetes sp. NU459]
MEVPSPPDMYDDNSDDQAEQWDNDVKHEGSSQTSPSTNLPNASTQAHGKPSIPMQKRRRVTRACDECRRKKIKCDGKQPCTHCTVYSYDCTYDQPSNRRRNPAPQYIEGLEHRVHRAETLLHMLMPDLNLSDPSIDVAVAQGYIPGLNNKSAASAQAPKTQPISSVPTESVEPKDTNLESMVRAIGQLELDEQGNWDYHGHSSGLSFVRRMREQLGDVMGPETRSTPFIKSRPMSQVFDSPKSFHAESPLDMTTAGTELPTEEVARELCGRAINDASCLLRAVHIPSFWLSFQRLYATPFENYTNQDHKFLPLFYSVIALGCLFGKDESSAINKAGYESAIEEGFKYFKAARQLLDIADCRDLTSIQAVIYMILFLQSSAKLSQCYAYVGVALRSALRMGLHRSQRSFSRTFNPIEDETRKRTFWTIRKMDIYIGAMLGLPQTLSDEDIDQDLPIEVEDEYITENGILPMPEGTTALSVAFNAHVKLVQILKKIVRNVYPIRAKDAQSSPDKSYTVPFSAIRELENDLENWKSNLAPGLDPAQEHDPSLTRAQQLLRIAYAHTQALLYRPFLHFVATDKRSRNIDQRAYTCAASYVNISRNIIHLCVQMKQKGLLNGAHWFIMYTTFFSVMSLVYFAAENPENATTEAVMKDAYQGKEVLASLARRSMAADRCTATLEVVFKGLPDWLREGHQNPVLSKKRRQSSNNSPVPQAARSHPDISAIAREPQPGIQRRTNTFPKHNSGGPLNSATAFNQQLTFAAPSQSSGSSSGPYTPTSPNFGQGGLVTGAVDTSPNELTCDLPMDLSNPNLPDLSAMMFPSAEPFNYPNQPLTTFENNQFGKDQAFFNSLSSASTPQMMGAGQASAVDNDKLEAQFYTLPPYMMQPSQQQLQQRQAAWNMGAAGRPSAQQSQPRQQQQQQQQMNGMQQLSGQYAMEPIPLGGGNESWGGRSRGGMGVNEGFPGINLNDIFGGEEWNGLLMDQGFRS